MQEKGRNKGKEKQDEFVFLKINMWNRWATRSEHAAVGMCDGEMECSVR